MTTEHDIAPTKPFPETNVVLKVQSHERPLAGQAILH